MDLLDLYCNVIDLDMLSYIFIAEEMDGCILLKPSLTYKGFYFLFFSGLNILCLCISNPANPVEEYSLQPPDVLHINVGKFLGGDK